MHRTAGTLSQDEKGEPGGRCGEEFEATTKGVNKERNRQTDRTFYRLGVHTGRGGKPLKSTRAALR